MRGLAGLMLLGLLVASPGAGSLIQVNTLVDELDGCAAGTGCSLREALAGAADGDSIEFAVMGTITLTLGELTPGSDVLVQGPGAGQLAVSGNFVSRVLTVAAGRAIELRDLTLRDGRPPLVGDPHGGCVKNAGALVLSGVRVEDCQARSMPDETPAAGGDGGGIYNAAGATLVLTRCVIRLGQAGAGGGDPFSPPAGGRGGGVFNLGSATLTESTLELNRAGTGGGPTGAGGDGGGIHSSGALWLERSTVAANASGDGAQFCAPTCVNGRDGKGGGLWASGETTLTNVTVSGNTIGSTAAGLSNVGGGLVLAPTAGVIDRLRNVTVAGNTASGAGGGLAREGAGTVRLRHTILGTNAAGTNDKDCTGGSAALVSEGWNLVRIGGSCASVFGSSDQVGSLAAPVEPGLGALGANGGPTATHALLAGSLALDAGDATGCRGWDPGTMTDVPLLVDQRGEGRPRDGDGDLAAICDPGAFEAPDAPVVTHLLAVTPLGAGVGRVSSTPPGIDCPGDCQQVYLEGTAVSLGASAEPGSAFAGWSGDCSGTADCQLTMDGDRAVGAAFVPLFPLVVSRTGAGSGAVTSSPPGISCGDDCSAEYPDGTAVDLVAVPVSPSIFVGWSGDCSGSAGCALVLAGPRVAVARFEPVAVFDDGFESGGLGPWSGTLPE